MKRVWGFESLRELLPGTKKHKYSSSVMVLSILYNISMITGWLLAQDSRRETQREISLLTSLITDTSFNNGKIWLSYSSVLLSFFITLQHFYPSLLTPLTFITMCNITMLIFYRKYLRNFIKIICIPPLIQQRQVIRVKINSSEIPKW